MLNAKNSIKGMYCALKIRKCSFGRGLAGKNKPTCSNRATQQNHLCSLRASDRTALSVI